MPSFLQNLTSRLFRHKSEANAGYIDEDNLPLPAEVDGYAALISSYIPYFNELPDALKPKFLRRVYFFKARKRFHYVNVEEKPEMPVLISAAAVQLTFGLVKYKLSYFTDVYIVPDAYPIDHYDGLYIGHVSPEGIYLSWKHFLEGYRFDKDNVNVAIHEMAHALEYDKFIRGVEVDATFRDRFDEYMAATGPLFAQLLQGKSSYLRNYAYTNMREFWAVSVEAFFENPQILKQELPDLYVAISKVLNQDPLTPGKILPRTG